MTEQFFNVLMKITDISLIIMLFVTAYSVYILFKRKNKRMVHIANFYLYFAWFCAAFVIWFMAMFVYVKKNLIYSPETADSAFKLLIFMIAFEYISISVQWLWSHYSFEIQEDRYVYHRLPFGKKETFQFEDIDVELSKFSSVSEKFEIGALGGFEILHLVMKDGRKRRIRFDFNIVGLSLFAIEDQHWDINIKFDYINLKYQKLEEAYKPKVEDSNLRRSKNTGNDRILKRKKAEKAKKKARKKKH